MYKLKTLIFPLILFGVAIFLHVYYKESATQLLFLAPGLVGLAVILTNNEEPINPPRFWGGIILNVISFATVAIVGATKMFG